MPTSARRFNNPAHRRNFVGIIGEKKRSIKLEPILMILGLGIGTLVGLTGVGGGALLTPLLILVVGVKPMTAVGTDLAFAAITKGVGAFQHRKHGKADFRLVYRLLFGSIPGAILGTWLMSMVEAQFTAEMDVIFTRVLGVVLPRDGLRGHVR